MTWLHITAMGFVAVVSGLLLFSWLKDMQKERGEPYRFEVGERVIRTPVFPADRYLVARFSDYRRMTITGRKRTWTGRKVYTTDVPGVPHPVRFPEGKMMKDIVETVANLKPQEKHRA